MRSLTLSCRENSWRNRLNPPTRWQEEVRQDKGSSAEQMVVLIAIARNIPFSRSHTTSKSRWCIEKQNSKLNREPLDARSSTIHVENSEATAVEIHLSSSTLYNNNAKKLISLSFPVPARSPPHSHGLEAGEHLVCVLRLEHRVLRRHEAQPEADEGHQVSQGTLWLTL